MDKYYTSVYSQNLNAYLNPNIRFIINMGGTSSSKTISVLQVLEDIADYSKNPLLISIVSESFPHLQKGVIRDFFKIIIGDTYNADNHNKTNSLYKVGNSQIEFFAVDQPGKALGSRRDVLYCNELNHISKSIFDELEIRTEKKIFIDFNPTSEFWVTELFDLPETVVIKSNYQNNIMLSESIKKRIEQRAEKDENFKRVHINCEWGSLEGLIFPDFTIIDSYPEKVKRERLGLDFGFNDPTALIRCGLIENNLYLDEILYQSGLTTSDIIRMFPELGITKNDTIIADNSRPETINEIHMNGWFIQPCDKGKDSVIAGINKIKQHKVFITKQSVNLINEFRNYSWLKDKLTGKHIEKPQDDWNHACFSKGTLIATDRGNIPIENIKINDLVLTRYGYQKVLESGITGIKETNFYIINNNIIQCTSDHLIYTLNRGFIKIKHLTQFDILFTLLEKKENSIWNKIAVQEYAQIKIGVNEPVYNLKIQNYPEFFANNVLVHNCDSVRYALQDMFYDTQTLARTL